MAIQGAASTKVHPGDHIWWDRHDWSQTDHVPAVVGSFPEPFLNGLGGKRLPIDPETVDVSSLFAETYELFRAQAAAGSARRHGGTGLGLSICKEIAAAHKWELAARNSGHGAEFILSYRLGDR